MNVINIATAKFKLSKKNEKKNTRLMYKQLELAYIVHEYNRSNK